jgi:hypothetical protein
MTLDEFIEFDSHIFFQITAKIFYGEPYNFILNNTAGGGYN